MFFLNAVASRTALEDHALTQEMVMKREAVDVSCDDSYMFIEGDGDRAV